MFFLLILFFWDHCPDGRLSLVPLYMISKRGCKVFIYCINYTHVCLYIYIYIYTHTHTHVTEHTQKNYIQLKLRVQNKKLPVFYINIQYHLFSWSINRLPTPHFKNNF